MIIHKPSLGSRDVPQKNLGPKQTDKPNLCIDYSFQLETLGDCKIVILRSKNLKLDLKRKLYVDFKNGLNLENPIKNESVDPSSQF